MKTATLPPLRVSPALRDAAERALQPGESLSRLMEKSLEHYLAYRKAQNDFVERGLQSAAAARQSGHYIGVDAVLAKLDATLEKARRAGQ